MIPTIVAFKWKPSPGYRSKYDGETVNVLRRMIARHYPKPHRFVCVTDDATGIDPDIEVMALWSDHANVPNPSGTRNPSCYRRMKVFAPDAGAIFGERIICIDLDTVVVGDLTPIFDRDEDFIIWGESDYPQHQWYNGSIWSLRAGTRPQVWTAFNPKTSPKEAFRAGRRGSDQGWFSHILGKGEATWGRGDGIYSYRVHIAPMGHQLPANARLVMFHGKQDPWAYHAQQIPWIREHYQ